MAGKKLKEVSSSASNLVSQNKSLHSTEMVVYSLTVSIPPLKNSLSPVVKYMKRYLTTSKMLEQSVIVK